jgi:hypothetical protein
MLETATIYRLHSARQQRVFYTLRLGRRKSNGILSGPSSSDDLDRASHRLIRFASS